MHTQYERQSFIFAAYYLPVSLVFVCLFFFTLPAHAATSVSSDSSLSQNLVSYWSLEEAAGTRTDVHGPNDLTDNNTVGVASGKLGYAADCEASEADSLSIGDGVQSGLDITGDMSIAAWIKPETMNETMLVTKWHHVDKTSYMFAMAAGGGLVWVNNAESSGYGYSGTTTYYSFATSSWTHVAVSYDASAGAASLFVNGTLIGTATGLDTSIANTNASFRLCGRDSATDYYDGLIDEIGVWSKALSPTDIENLYNDSQGLPYAEESITTVLATRKNADETVVSSASLQNDDELELTLASSTEYVVDVQLVASTTSRDPGMKVAFAIPTGSEMLMAYVAQAGTDVIGGDVLALHGTAGSEIRLSRESVNVVRLTGTVKTGASGGTFSLQWAQYTSTTAPVTVGKGSYIRAQAI